VGMQPNTVRQGDCIKILKELEPGSVDLAFADPPFNIGYDYDVYDDRRGRQDYLKWSREWISAVSDVLKPTGTFWLAIGDEYAAELKLIAQDEIGFTCRSWVIWYYTFGVNCVRGFSRSHTHLFHFVKNPLDFTFNSDNPAVRVLSARQLVYADNRANAKGRLPDNTWLLRPQDVPPPGFAPSHDTWYFARVAGTFKEREGFHGCQMPEQLLGRIIRVSSHPQDLVLDPFAGSGTTLTVAKKLSRQWFGCELSVDYAERINQRLATAEVGGPLDGPADPIRSSPQTSRGKKKLKLRNGRPVPHCDPVLERGIIAAYQESCRGKSADYLICDPVANADFVSACKHERLAGDAFLWNRLLLRIRKAGKLPKSDRSATRLTFDKMDAFSFASEIAMQLLSLDYDLKLDDILCSPSVAEQFDAIAKQIAPGFTSFEYRWAALSIRKRARKSKKLATTRFADWLERDLPRSIPVGRCSAKKYQQPGVYLLGRDRETVYVGETLNLRERIEHVLQNEFWSSLNSTSVTLMLGEPPRLQHGLQSLLIRRTKPLLNSQLLRPELKATVEIVPA